MFLVICLARLELEHALAAGTDFDVFDWICIPVCDEISIPQVILVFKDDLACLECFLNMIKCAIELLWLGSANVFSSHLVVVLTGGRIQVLEERLIRIDGANDLVCSVH